VFALTKIVVPNYRNVSQFFSLFLCLTASSRAWLKYCYWSPDFFETERFSLTRSCCKMTDRFYLILVKAVGFRPTEAWNVLLARVIEVLTLRSDQIQFLNNRKNVDKTKGYATVLGTAKGVRRHTKIENHWPEESRSCSLPFQPDFNRVPSFRLKPNVSPHARLHMVNEAAQLTLHMNCSIVDIDSCVQDCSVCHFMDAMPVIFSILMRITSNEAKLYNQVPSRHFVRLIELL